METFRKRGRHKLWLLALLSLGGCMEVGKGTGKALALGKASASSPVVSKIPAAAEIVYYQEGLIYVMDRDGRNVVRLTSKKRTWEHVAVSPDRRYVVGNEQKDDPKIPGFPRSALWLYDLERGTETALVPHFHSAGNGGVDWDNNGFIYFSGRPNPVEGPVIPKTVVDNAGRMDVYKVRFDGSQLTQLTNTPDGAEGDVSVSDDGSMVACTKWVFDSYDLFGAKSHMELWVMNSDGSNRRLALMGGDPPKAGIFDPEFSSDKQRLAFSQVNSTVSPNFPDNPAANTAHDIWTVKLDGTDKRRMTQPGPISIIPDWNGGTILYQEISERGGYNGVSMVNEDGTSQRRVKAGVLFAKWIGSRRTETLTECKPLKKYEEYLCPYNPVTLSGGFLSTNGLTVFEIRGETKNPILKVPAGYNVSRTSVAPNKRRLLLTMGRQACDADRSTMAGAPCSYGNEQVWVALKQQHEQYGEVYRLKNLAPLYGLNSDIHGWTSWASNNHAFFNGAAVQPGETMNFEDAPAWVATFRSDQDITVEHFGGEMLDAPECLTGRVFPSQPADREGCVDGQRVVFARRCKNIPVSDQNWAMYNAKNNDGTGDACLSGQGRQLVPVLKVYALELDANCRPKQKFDAAHPITEPRADGLYRHMGVGPEWGNMQPTISPDGEFVAYVARKGFDSHNPDDACEALNDPLNGFGKGDGASRVFVCHLGSDLKCQATIQLTDKLKDFENQGQPFFHVENGQMFVTVSERRYLDGHEAPAISRYRVGANEAGTVLDTGFGGFPIP